jgi:hypothetical protein
VFPQFADGKFSDGTYYRTADVCESNSTATADCTHTPSRNATDGFNTFTGSVPPGNSVVAPTSGTQSFQSGYATMQCSASVDAQALYSYYGANGVKLAEATVFSSPSASIVQILADSREGARVAMAIANDSDQATTYTITVADATGKVVGTTTQTIPARTAVAKFVAEMVTLPMNHVGQVIVSSTTGTASIIGLRFSGNAFTTIPATIR